MSIMDNSWMPRDIEGKRFLMNYRFTENSYVVYLCDLTAVYVEEVHGNQAVQKNLELNPNIEIEPGKLLNLVKSSMETSQLKLLKASTDEIHLETYFMIGGVKLYWRFCTSLCKPTVLKDMLLSPLLGMIAELLKRQKQLTDSIKKKDVEIEDYKNNGATLSRAYLETEKFNEEDFLSNDKLVKAKEEDIWNTVFNGAGQLLLKAVSEACPVVPDSTVPENNVKPTQEMIEEEDSAVISQVDVELKRRQELASITTTVKAKKKKKFNI